MIITRGPAGWWEGYQRVYPPSILLDAAAAAECAAARAGYAFLFARAARHWP